MQAFETRAVLLAARGGLSARQLAEELLRLRSGELGLRGMPSRGAAAGRHVGAVQSMSIRRRAS